MGKTFAYWEKNYNDTHGPLEYLQEDIRLAATSFRRNTTLTEAEVIALGAERMDDMSGEPDAEFKIYAWMDGTDIFWWSNAETTRLRDNSNRIFFNMYKIRSIDVSGIDVSEMTDMNQMFSYCMELETITGLEGWDVSGVRTMSGMFFNCNALTSLDALLFWDTSNVARMSCMFFRCSKLARRGTLSSHIRNMYLREHCSD